MEEQLLIGRTSCVECDGTQAERQSLEGVEQPCVNFKERIVKEDIASVAGEQQKFREAAAAGNFAVRRDEETMPRPRLEEPVVAQIIERHAHNGAADLEACAELAFRRQRFGTVPPGKHHFDDILADQHVGGQV